MTARWFSFGRVGARLRVRLPVSDVDGSVDLASNGGEAAPHNHDDDYCAMVHDHPHDHDADYSLTGHSHSHDHDPDYAGLVHGHAIADSTGLQAALDGKTATGHGHAQADVTSLVSDLAGKAASGHNHDVAYSAAAHDHDGDYAAPHAHPYAADDHTHPGGSEAFPVGSVFIAVVSTNPGTLLGYGTWSAFAAGRMLVGLDSGQTEFDTVEETGGAKTVTLTAAQSGLPQHTHVQNAHGHTISGGSSDDTSAPFTGPDASTSTATALGGGIGTTVAVNQDAGPTDAAQAHPNLPPYVVVYMWKRTA